MPSSEYETLVAEDGSVHVVPADEDHELVRDCHCRPGAALEHGKPVMLHFPRLTG